MPTTTQTILCPKPGPYSQRNVAPRVEGWSKLLPVEQQTDERGELWEVTIELDCEIVYYGASYIGVEPLPMPEPAGLMWGLLLVCALAYWRKR